MGILSSIFGTGSVIEKGMDLIDSFHTSDTELIEAKSKAKTDLMAAYAPFKIAQRWLMVIASINFFLVMWAVIGLWAFGVEGQASELIDIINAFNLGWIMFTIVAFYFGGGVIEGGIGKLNEKKSK